MWSACVGGGLCGCDGRFRSGALICISMGCRAVDYSGCVVCIVQGCGICWSLRWCWCDVIMRGFASCCFDYL